MPQPIVKAFPEKSQTLADTLADYVIKEQDIALKNSNEFVIVVSGGSLVSTLRKALLNRLEIKWPKW